MDNLLAAAKKRQDDYRPLPFWSWNDELEPERLAAQVRCMKDAGLGGFFMHARTGLKTKYMGSHWFACIDACIKEAQSCGIQPWGYDENGYPSGIAGGEVCETSEDYRSSWVELIQAVSSEDAGDFCVLAYYSHDYERCTAEDFKGGFILILKNETRAADPMNPEAVDLFIRMTHERYKRHFDDQAGAAMPGFFTDEPQFKQYQLPWSKDIDKIFHELYGYDILDVFPCLKNDELFGKEEVRHDYWMLINRLYCEGFGKMIGQWCRQNNFKFTGHIMGEDTILEQMGSNGGAMPFYQHMDIPGTDWLGRRIGSPLAVKQVASAAIQTGHRQVLSETFALAGWDVSFAELKWIAEWQMVNGINLLCPHLQSYSIRGIRKRDYPASLFIQEPWWNEYKIFTDYISSLGAILGESREHCQLLVVHPLHTAHILYNGSADCAAVRGLDSEFCELSDRLQTQHIPYHYGDETILRHYGKVDGNQLKVGEATYAHVLLPSMDNILSSTLDLLEVFLKNGGQIYSAGRMPRFVDGCPSDRALNLKVKPLCEKYKAELSSNFSVSVTEKGIECPHIQISLREKNGERLCFLVNTDLYNKHSVNCRFAGIETLCEVVLPDFTLLDLEHTKGENGVSALLTFKPGQSFLLLDREATGNENRTADNANKIETVTVSLPDSLTISRSQTDLNCLTLDCCEYKLEGENWQELVPLILLQKRLLDGQTDQNISLRFYFDISMSDLPKKLYAVSENVPCFTMKINGVLVKSGDEYWIDKDFKKTDIAAHVRQGKNELILEGRFYQRRELYDYLYREKDLSSNFYDVDFEFEAVTYDIELESLYLLGDFCVESHTPYNEGERKALFTRGPFTLTDSKKTVLTGDITTQGYPFFAGKMKLDFTCKIFKEEGKRYLLDIEEPVCPAARLIVNGQDAGILAWEPYTADITPFLQDGKNENNISLILYSGLRNLLGPHHFKYGESHYVGVSTFADMPGWCESIENIRGNIWDDGYCFVKFGIL